MSNMSHFSPIEHVNVLQDLKDPLNYGLFLPPSGGRVGKFLDEERLLQEYPLPGPFGRLEVCLFYYTYLDGLSAACNIWH